MTDYAMFTVCVFTATLVSIVWLGPYWFLLIAAVVFLAWLLVACLIAAGRADEQMERMRWDRTKSRGD